MYDITIQDNVLVTPLNQQLHFLSMAENVFMEDYHILPDHIRETLQLYLKRIKIAVTYQNLDGKTCLPPLESKQTKTKEFTWLD